MRPRGSAGIDAVSADWLGLIRQSAPKIPQQLETPPRGPPKTASQSLTKLTHFNSELYEFLADLLGGFSGLLGSAIPVTQFADATSM